MLKLTQSGGAPFTVHTVTVMDPLPSPVAGLCLQLPGGQCGFSPAVGMSAPDKVRLRPWGGEVNRRKGGGRFTPAVPGTVRPRVGSRLLTPGTFEKT